MPGLPRRHKRHDFRKDQVVHGYNPIEDGFAYPDSDQPSTILEPAAGCTCTVGPPSSLLVETDTERAFRAARVELCATCLAALLA